jgi:hypothetical protein
MTYDLLFRRWLRLEIERIVSEIATTLTPTDNECYVYVTELCKLVSLVNQGDFPSVQPFASSFGMVDSHDQLRGLFLKVENGATYGELY